MPVDPESLKTLSRTPPPAAPRAKFKTYATAMARINFLHGLLGTTDREPKSFNISRLNERIVKLENRLSEKTTPAEPPAKPAPEKPALETTDFSEIRSRCLALETELGVPHEQVGADLLPARARLFCLESTKASRASKALLDSLPRPVTVVPPPVPSAPPVEKPAPELHGRARFVQSCRIFGADKERPTIDPSLRGRERMLAAINASGIIDQTKPVEKLESSESQEAERPKAELRGRERMLATMKIQNITE